VERQGKGRVSVVSRLGSLRHGARWGGTGLWPAGKRGHGDARRGPGMGRIGRGKTVEGLGWCGLVVEGGGMVRGGTPRERPGWQSTAGGNGGVWRGEGNGGEGAAGQERVR